MALAIIDDRDHLAACAFQRPRVLPALAGSYDEEWLRKDLCSSQIHAAAFADSVVCVQYVCAYVQYPR